LSNEQIAISFGEQIKAVARTRLWVRYLKWLSVSLSLLTQPTLEGQPGSSDKVEKDRSHRAED
jgi:hypothetical protein